MAVKREFGAKGGAFVLVMDEVAGGEQIPVLQAVDRPGGEPLVEDMVDPVLLEQPTGIIQQPAEGSDVPQGIKGVLLGGLPDVKPFLRREIKIYTLLKNIDKNQTTCPSNRFPALQ